MPKSCNGCQNLAVGLNELCQNLADGSNSLPKSCRWLKFLPYVNIVYQHRPFPRAIVVHFINTGGTYNESGDICTQLNLQRVNVDSQTELGASALARTKLWTPGDV